MKNKALAPFLFVVFGCFLFTSCVKPDISMAQVSSRNLIALSEGADPTLYPEPCKSFLDFQETFPKSGKEYSHFGLHSKEDLDTKLYIAFSKSYLYWKGKKDFATKVKAGKFFLSAFAMQAKSNPCKLPEVPEKILALIPVNVNDSGLTNENPTIPKSKDGLEWVGFNIATGVYDGKKITLSVDLFNTELPSIHLGSFEEEKKGKWQRVELVDENLNGKIDKVHMKFCALVKACPKTGAFDAQSFFDSFVEQGINGTLPK